MAELTTQPLVTVLTPVYNGDRYLSDCIESVLKQSYQNWEYHIIDNRSTDDTPKIAQSYAAKDPRIRVFTYEEFLSMPQNFNRAFSTVSKTSSYFKVVCADDWILPDCLTKMVAFAESHPSVGILCCYQQSGENVRWTELPNVQTLPGKEAARTALLKGTQMFGAPTGFLYRSNLLRLGKPFYPNNQPHSDTSACYEFLDHCDYGIVHEVLAVERVHEDQISTSIEGKGAGSLASLEGLLEYGPKYLTPDEFAARKIEAFNIYYRYLGGCVWKLGGGEFWRFQRKRLRELGTDLSLSRVTKEALKEAFTELKSPGVALKKAIAVIAGKRHGSS